MPVKDLKLLASHTILMGAHLNHLIDGLQTLVRENGLVKWLDDDSEINDLKELSGRVDEEIGRVFVKKNSGIALV